MRDRHFSFGKIALWWGLETVNEHLGGDPSQSLPRRESAGWAWELWGYVILAVAGSLFGVVGLLFTGICMVLEIVLPRRLRPRVGRACIHYLFRFFLRVVVVMGGMRIESDALAELNGAPPVIIAPNHLTLFDAIFVIARVPNVVCVMKAKIWDNPVLGGGARLAGYIRNDAPASMVKQACEQLEKGTHLLVFPEGTRMVRPPVNPFKGGFALISKRSGAPVQTVFLEANSRFLGKGWPFGKKPRFPLHYRLRLGERITFPDGGDTKSFVAELEDYYRRHLSS